MRQLLATYGLTEILSFVVILALAFKGVASYFDWFQERNKKSVLKSLQPEELSKRIEAEVHAREKEIQKLKDMNDVLKQEMEAMNAKLDLLINSDKDDIKSFITREYHYFVEEKGWIDDYSLDCIERRYEHYKEENGNSFIGDLMYELRKLPKSKLDNK